MAVVELMAVIERSSTRECRRGRGVSEHARSSPGRLPLLPGSADQQPLGVIALDQGARSRVAGGQTSMRVLIAAGHALVRASYRALLERDERIEVVAEAASGEQALALATATAPNVALLDLQLPGLDDHEETAAIVSDSALAHTAVMLIALSESDERVLSALRAGAIGVLSNDTEPAELIRALQVLADGQALLPAGVLRRLLTELPPQPHHTHLPIQLHELTDREREVVALVGTGLSDNEIATHLVIRPATAKTHVSRAMGKLDIRDRAKLVVLATKPDS
jgi:DNA-binding NarL/FixJ family response regulator